VTHASRVTVHVVGVVAITLVVIACRFLPFLPGKYDTLAVTVSIVAQMIGFLGLVLVPIGAAWLVYEWSARLEKPKRHYFAIPAVLVSAFIGLVGCLGALLGSGYLLGVGLLALWTYVVWQMIAGVRRLRANPVARFNPTPLYLVVIPVVVALAQFTLLDRAADRSRERVIQKSAQLINDIEQYHRMHGHYPPSLLALHPDYKTGAIGVERFYYEPNGEAYNVYFEQLSTAFGAREIVMYNKRNEHNFLSHDSDRLLWTPEQIQSRRTYLAVNDALTPYWKYFLFD
jgi:hypothetical protein